MRRVWCSLSLSLSANQLELPEHLLYHRKRGELFAAVKLVTITLHSESRSCKRIVGSSSAAVHLHGPFTAPTVGMDTVSPRYYGSLVAADDISRIDYISLRRCTPRDFVTYCVFSFSAREQSV